MLKLNIERWNYLGLMAYNKDIKAFIEKNGKPLLKNYKWEMGKKFPNTSKHLTLLHIPSGKISTYKMYYWDIRNDKKGIVGFDGFGDSLISNPYEEFLWVYDDDLDYNTIKTKSTSFHPDDNIDEFFKENKRKPNIIELLKEKLKGK